MFTEGDIGIFLNFYFLFFNLIFQLKKGAHYLIRGAIFLKKEFVVLAKGSSICSIFKIRDCFFNLLGLKFSFLFKMNNQLVEAYLNENNKLDGSNYFGWKFKLQTLLEGHNAWEIMNMMRWSQTFLQEEQQ